MLGKVFGFCIAVMALAVAGPALLAGGTSPAKPQPQAQHQPQAAASINPAAQGVVHLHAQANGHFWADLQIGGAHVRAMVDTGASVIALSYEDALKIGRRPQPGDRTAAFHTANGVVTAHLVRLPEVRLHGIRVFDVEAAIMPAGAMKGTLLGMSFMRKLASFESRSGAMVLRQ